MPRPADNWQVVGAAVARVLSLPPPAWVSPRTVALLTDALASLRRDALAATSWATTREAPGRLGMGRTLYMAALAPGGWLSLDAPPGATLAEVFAAHDAAQGAGRPRST